MRFKYEDVHPAYTYPGYTCTNEEPETWHSLLRGITAKRIGCIASGGEIVLFNLLPRCTGELIAVDHSYHSLSFFLSKLLLLEEMGPEALHAAILRNEWTTLATRAKPQLPDQVRRHLTLYADSNILREWRLSSLPALRASYKKLDRLTILHGDWADLLQRGPFDLLYLSNMPEHTTNRVGQLPPWDSTLSCLKNQGKFLWSQNIGSTLSPPTDLAKELKRSNHHRALHTWTYRLCEKLYPQPPTAGPAGVGI